MSVQPVVVDSRKFIGQLNESAQAKVAIYESHVRKLGSGANKNWQLAGLYSRQLYIEDRDTHEYMVADHTTSHGKINIYNIRPVKIVEGQKKGLFEDAALKLINALQANDQKAIGSAFTKLQQQRFSSRVVPHCGTVRCRDGITRRINVESTDVMHGDIKGQLVKLFAESLRDRIVVENGHVVGGSFGNQTIKLPVTKWGMRKLVARQMREAAENAYWSTGFQDRIASVASLISEFKIEEATKEISPFLKEMEEFCLLSEHRTRQLIKNTLAAKGIFNHRLVEDTATLFYRTNLKVNKPTILREWRNIAKKVSHSALVENVIVLSESKNFNAAYNKFLDMVFETISNREVAAESLATTLGSLRDRTPKIKESHELSAKLNSLIGRLQQQAVDDAAIYEAEDLIATLQEELGATSSLNDFDQMPGDEDDPLEATQEIDAEAGTPVININSPLIQIGGSSTASGDGADEDLGLGGDDLGSMLGDQDQAPDAQQNQQPAGAPPAGPPMGGPQPGGPPMGGPQPGGQPLMQSIDRHLDAINEGYDPYASGQTSRVERRNLGSYGSPVITNYDDLQKISSIMQRVADKNNLVGDALTENIHKLARASIKAAGLIIPDSKLPFAIDQVVSFVNEEWQKPWLHDDAEEENDDDTTDDSDDEVAEDQYKIPLRKPAGLARSGHKKSLGKKSATHSESIQWLHSQDDAMLGEYNGVRFVFDHGGDNEKLAPVILSEDAAIEIPIPRNLYNQAFAAAQIVEGASDKFIAWLDQSIDQLRPLNAHENRSIDEAVATITAGPDGSISVEVSDDVEVSDGVGAGDEVDEFADSEEDIDMTPVDATDTTDMDGGMGGDFDSDQSDVESPEDLDDNEFGGADGGDEFGGTNDDDAGDDDEEEEPLTFEDRDISSPPSSSYTKHVGDDKRDTPAAKLPKKPGAKLDGIGPEVVSGKPNGSNAPVARSKGSDN